MCECVCSQTINAGAGVNERAQVSLPCRAVLLLRMSLPASTSRCCLEPPCKVHEMLKSVRQPQGVAAGGGRGKRGAGKKPHVN